MKENSKINASQIILTLFLIVVSFVIGSFLNFDHKKSLKLRENEDISLQLTAPSYQGGQYAMDNNQTYWITSREIDSEATSTFKIFKGNLQPSIYSTPGREYMQYAYGTDGKNLFYKGQASPTNWTAVKPFDPNTFEPIENGTSIHHYGKTKDTVYYGSMPIEGADPLTFEILWSRSHEGCSNGPFSKDETNVYYENWLVKDADANTFEPIIDNYGKDKKHVYLKTQIQEGLDPLNFKPTPECDTYS